MWADRLAERGPLLRDILGSTVETKNKTRIFIYSLSDQAIDLHIVIPRDQNKSQVSI